MLFRSSQWDKLLRRKHPYDAAPYSKDDVSAIITVGGPPLAEDAKPDVLYQVSFAVEGPHPDEEMKGKLKLLLDTLRVGGR